MAAAGPAHPERQDEDFRAQPIDPPRAHGQLLDQIVLVASAPCQLALREPST